MLYRELTLLISGIFIIFLGTFFGTVPKYSFTRYTFYSKLLIVGYMFVLVFGGSDWLYSWLSAHNFTSREVLLSLSVLTYLVINP